MLPDDDKIPWPRPGDVLFSDGADWLNACVGWSIDQWYPYAEGYKLAANTVVQSVIDTQRNQDLLIYPIIFLYRHAIEISLKHLIWDGSQLLHREVKLKAIHPLMDLWREARPILEKVWPNGPKKDLDAVGEVLEQFDARDQKSMTFRYPVDKDGSPSLSKDERIHIGNFAEVANRVLSLLEGCTLGIGEYLQQAQEAEQENEGGWGNP